MRVDFWMQNNDSYEDYFIDIDTTDKEEAIKEAKKYFPRGKSFKVE